MADALLRGVLSSNDEVVYLGEDLDVPAIVHDNDVIVVRAVLVDGGLI